MNVVLQTVLSLLSKLIPSLTSADGEVISLIITTLEQLVPVVIQEFKDLAPIVQNVIADLKGSGAVSQDEWDSLDSLEQQIDAEFNQAASDEGV